jgi:hypothetical protein
MQPPEPDDSLPIEEITRATAALFEQVPRVVQKLGDRVAYSKEGSLGRVCAGEFRQVCGPEDGSERSLSYL